MAHDSEIVMKKVAARPATAQVEGEGMKVSTIKSKE
jgi:hypothetical protein